MTVLIIEGPDLVGKSYAIEKLAKHFKQGFMIKNLYKPDKAGDHKIWQQYHKIVDFIGSNTDSLVILDRFFPSQVVYSILRGEDDSALPIVKKLEADIRHYKGFYIQFTCSMTELERRYKKLGDEHVSLKQLKLIAQRYDDYYWRCSLNKMMLDTRNKDWIKDIEKFTGLKKHDFNT